MLLQHSTATEKELIVMTTAAEHRAKAADSERRRHESEERSDTDGFLSQWAHGITGRMEQRNAEIADAGGIVTFYKEQLLDLENNPVAAKLIQGKYGLCWALEDEAGKFTGTFISAHPKREATMHKKGYQETRMLIVAEAEAYIAGSGTGLSGAASCSVAIRPKDKTLKYDGVKGLGALS